MNFHFHFHSSSSFFFHKTLNIKDCGEISPKDLFQSSINFKSHIYIYLNDLGIRLTNELVLMSGLCGLFKNGQLLSVPTIFNIHFHCAKTKVASWIKGYCQRSYRSKPFCKNWVQRIIKMWQCVCMNRLKDYLAAL